MAASRQIAHRGFVTNRKKIESFCKSNNLRISSLKYIRSVDTSDDRSLNASYWQLGVIHNEKERIFDADGVNYTIEENINEMFDDIKYWMNEE